MHLVVWVVGVVVEPALVVANHHVTRLCLSSLLLTAILSIIIMIHTIIILKHYFPTSQLNMDQ
jgi:hypothetical protein